MSDITILHMSLAELCQATDLPSEILIEIIEEGIIEPSGGTPTDWQFSVKCVSIAQKALRLRRDLEIDWPGIALAISLIEELEQLRREKHQLEQRLQRFSPDSE